MTGLAYRATGTGEPEGSPVMTTIETGAVTDRRAGKSRTDSNVGGCAPVAFGTPIPIPVFSGTSAGYHADTRPRQAPKREISGCGATSSAHRPG